ncbi:MAG: hypothetical protein WEA04_04045 [Candidatus Andersenbacteria bacterium]
MLKRFISYYKNNPGGYWFKRTLYGWGWVPVRWQGWLVIAVALAVGGTGYYIGEIDDSPGMIFIGFMLMFSLIFGFGHWKGEKLCWQWGLPKEQKDEA